MLPHIEKNKKDKTETWFFQSIMNNVKCVRHKEVVRPIAILVIYLYNKELQCTNNNPAQM